MTTFPFDTVLFDLDGTLVDSALDLGPAINHALAAEGRGPVPLATIRQLIGGGARIMLENALRHTGGMVEQERFDALLALTLAHYWAHIADSTRPFPGVLQALDALAAQGCALAVCTNKSEAPARDLLEKLGMSGRFQAVYGGDTLGRERAKPAPDMLLAAAKDCGGGRAVMVGDTTFDVGAARAAGMPVAVFTAGYLDAAADDLDCDVAFADWHTLPAMLHDL